MASENWADCVKKPSLPLFIITENVDKLWLTLRSLNPTCQFLSQTILNFNYYCAQFNKRTKVSYQI